MSASADGALEGEALLEAVTAAMVALHVRYYGRAPGGADTRLMGGELLACLMGEVYTEVEKTMIELVIGADRRARERGRRLVIVKGPRQVHQSFVLTGLDDRLEIVEDLALIVGAEPTLSSVAVRPER